MSLRKNIFLALSVALGFVARPLHGQKTNPACAIKFSLAERDTLGNVDVGFGPDGQKWFEKKVAKRYPNVCYVEQKPNAGIWFYISISTRTQDTAIATTRTSPDGSTSHTTVTPNTTAYPIYTLKIGRFHDGNLEILRTFQRTKGGSGGGSVTDLLASFGNPEHDVIVDAVSWLSSSGVNDPSE